MKKIVTLGLFLLVVTTMLICLVACANDLKGTKEPEANNCQLTFPANDAEMTEYNKSIFEIEPFDIQFQLPEGWSLGDYDPQASNYLYSGVWSRVGIYDADGTCVGAVGYNIYDAGEVVEGEPMSIFHQVALGNDYQFNVRETYTVVKETEQYRTATTNVCYAPGFTENIGEDGVINYGILMHAIDRTIYVAFEFDHEALSVEELAQIADSAKFA